MGSIHLSALLCPINLVIFVVVERAHADMTVGVTVAYGSKTSLKDPALVEYIKTLGIQDDGLVEDAMEAGDALTVKLTKMNSSMYELRYGNSGSRIPSRLVEFQSGEEFNGSILDDSQRLQTILIGEGLTIVPGDGKKQKDPRLSNGEITRVIKMDGYETTQQAKFHSGGMTLTLKAKEAVATIEFEPTVAPWEEGARRNRRKKTRWG